MPEVLTVKEFVFWATLISFGWGLVLGLIPLFLGIKRNKRQLGLYGLLVSAVGGALLSAIFSVIVVVIFVVLILKSPAADAGQPPAGTAETAKTDNP